VRNPHFNKLGQGQTIKLEKHQISYNEDKLYELFTMWNDYRDFGIKPWDVKGKFLVEDIAALRMMMIIQKDVDRMNEKSQSMKGQQKR